MDSFSEALIEAHSLPDNEPVLVKLILSLYQAWDDGDAGRLHDSKGEMLEVVVARLRQELQAPPWNLSNEEFGELADEDNIIEFKATFIPPASTQAKTG